MNPCRCAGRLEGRHPLRQQTDSNAGQNVTRPRGRQGWRGGRCNACPTIRRGDDGVTTFQEDDRAAGCSGGPCPLQSTAGDVGEQAAELTIMGGQQALIVEGGKQLARLDGKNAERVGI